MGQVRPITAHAVDKVGCIPLGSFFPLLSQWENRYTTDKAALSPGTDLYDPSTRFYSNSTAQFVCTTGLKCYIFGLQ